jgi:phage terminase large subunit-like protein
MPRVPKTTTRRGRPQAAWKQYAAGSEVTHFATFCKTYLVQWIDQWAGKPLTLEAFQRQMMGEALAYDSNGWPVWNSTIICMPRKNGKTVLLAAYAVYRLLTSEGSPEILLAASSDKQAGRLFDACAAFIRGNDELARLCRVRDYMGEIVREDGRGRIVRVASDPGKLHGYNPSLVICDELAQWTTPTLRRAYAALTTGGGARKAPQVFTITTAGEAHQRRDSILGQILDRGLASDGCEQIGSLSICRMTDAKTLVWNYEAATADPTDTKAMKAANPASWITKGYLKRQAENPELTTAQVLQLHGCVWAEAEETWIGPDAWAARESQGGIAPGVKVVLGFDGSYRRDATALVACALDGHIAPIKIWERPLGAPPDWKIPRSEVNDTVALAMEHFEVLELACDPPGWHAEIDVWQELYGDVVIDFDTASRQRMAPACDRFRSGVFEGGLTHNGDPVLARHVGHCIAHETPHGVIATKNRDLPHKIDAAIAAIIAYDRAMWHASEGAHKAEPWLMVV